RTDRRLVTASYTSMIACLAPAIAAPVMKPSCPDHCDAAHRSLPTQTREMQPHTPRAGRDTRLAGPSSAAPTLTTSPAAAPASTRFRRMVRRKPEDYDPWA